MNTKEYKTKEGLPFLPGFVDVKCKGEIDFPKKLREHMATKTKYFKIVKYIKFLQVMIGTFMLTFPTRNLIDCLCEVR
jgi:hypothetical protein